MTSTSSLSLILAFAVVSVPGCMRTDVPQTPAATPTATCSHPARIALLGDRTRLQLLKQIAAASNAPVREHMEHADATTAIGGRRVTVSTGYSDTVSAHAAICAVADLAVVAVDARNGPMPVHREHILFARQMDIPSILIAFTHSDAIGDPELLELEELELRELLTAYGWNGDEAIVGYDSERARVQHVVGAPMGADALSGCCSRSMTRSPTPFAAETHGCTLEVYALAEVEAFPLKTTGISTGEYTLILGKSVGRVRVQSASTIRPGQSGAVHVTFDSPRKVQTGQRCVLLTDDHIAGAGAVSDSGLHEKTRDSCN